MIELLVAKSLQIFIILFKPYILGQRRVISSAYDNAPKYVPLMWHPRPEFFKVTSNLSMYKLNRVGESTPPCFTPLSEICGMTRIPYHACCLSHITIHQ